MIAFLEENVLLNLHNSVNLFPTSYITIDRSKLVASGGFADVYRVDIKHGGSGHQEFAQKLIERDLKLLTKDQIIEFFRTVFMEVNVMFFIS